LNAEERSAQIGKIRKIRVPALLLAPAREIRKDKTKGDADFADLIERAMILWLHPREAPGARSFPRA